MLRLSLGQEDPMSVWAREIELREDAMPMPGLDDILVGRDFLLYNNLLFVVDGSAESFSLLHPVDEENRRKREMILSTLRPQ